MKNKKIFKLLFSTLMICTLVISGFTPLKIKANEHNEYAFERARPTEQVYFYHTENISSSGNQSFKVRILCTNTYISSISAITSYTAGNSSLTSVSGGEAVITGEGTDEYKTPDNKYTAYVVEIDVDYTPDNTSSKKRYTVKFYIIDGELYDSACEARK